VEAQRRMRSSVVLFCGFRALNAEICKNVVLAGVSVAIQDSAIVEEQDLGANFFLRNEHVGKNVRDLILEFVLCWFSRVDSFLKACRSWSLWSARAESVGQSCLHYKTIE